MKALLSAAVELCLLRLGPQYIPASSVLFGVLLLLNLMLGTLLFMMMRFEFHMALLESLFEVGTMLVMLHGALKLVHKPRRFNQTGSSLLLSGLLLNLLAVPLVSWNQRTASAESALLLLLLNFWSIVVMGHIVRHAFNVDLNIGIAASFLYFLVILNLTTLLFPMAA